VVASSSASQSIFLFIVRKPGGLERHAWDLQTHNQISCPQNVWDAYKKCNGPNEERKFAKPPNLEPGNRRCTVALSRPPRWAWLPEKASDTISERSMTKSGVIELVQCKWVEGRGNSCHMRGNIPKRCTFRDNSQAAATPYGTNRSAYSYIPAQERQDSSAFCRHLVAFHEKFGTSNRVSVSTHALSIHSLMIFGSRRQAILRALTNGSNFVSCQDGVRFMNPQQVDLCLKAVIEGALEDEDARTRCKGHSY
jgi:hypothetical protein